MWKWSTIGAAILIAAVVGATLHSYGSIWATSWQNLDNPGPLSSAHAFLAENCAGCHTPVTGVDAMKCIGCHANDRALLQRQPTAFHAEIRSCSPCHLEHLGARRRLIAMDHTALARIGLRALRAGGSESEQRAKRFATWVRSHDSSGSIGENPHITALESILDCASCHATRDRHWGLFGRDCAACHATSNWTVAGYLHPSPRSTDCAQCHKPPPSHFMGHFAMVSRRVAGRPEATVQDCYVCHQTTAWNDIKAVGLYKHH